LILIQDGKRYDEIKFSVESDFEEQILAFKETILGKDAIYIDAKKKIGTLALGNTIPDGFLFDLSDPDDFEFYIVEIELEKHDFYNHIFPQITKFFAFFKNSKRQKELVEKLFSTINTDASLKRRFKKYLGQQEIFKFLSDLIDASQNILLVIDGAKPELPEITDTYSDTWGKMVRVLEVKKFGGKEGSIITVDPAFENLEFSYEEGIEDTEKKATQYSEEFHLEGSTDVVKQVYKHLKKVVRETDDSYVFNPQKYYVSIKGPKNIVFLKIRKKKIRMIVMLPEKEIRAVISHHSVKTLSQPVQNFYNGPCAAVDVEDMTHIDEIQSLVELVMNVVETD
jgi:predicted transport protein